MHIQCPNCETIFDLQKRYKINSKYKCSVCNHVWVEKKNKPKQNAEKATINDAKFMQNGPKVDP